MTLLHSPRLALQPGVSPPMPSRSGRRSSRNLAPPQASGAYVAPLRQLTRTQSYRPVLHRTIPLALFASAVLALIGVLEYSIHVLPHDAYRFSPSKVGNAAFAVTTPAAMPMAPTSQPPPSSPPPGPPPTERSLTLTPSPPSPQPEAQAPTQAASKVEPNAAPSHSSSQTLVSLANVQDPLQTSKSEIKTHTVPEPTVSTPGISRSVSLSTTSTSVEATRASKPSSTNIAVPTARIENGFVTSEVPFTLVTRSSYFLGIYLPILGAVLLRALAGGLYRYTKLIDPFTMLSRPNGTLLKDFFHADHLDSRTLLVSWPALCGRRWTVLVAAAMYGATQLLILFASELNTIYESTYNKQVATNDVILRGEALWINQTIARTLQALVVLVFVCIAALWLMLRKHHSSLVRNPASLAAIVSLVGHPSTDEDLASVSMLADEDIVKALNDRQYRLQSYTGSNKHDIIGIVPTDVRYEDLHSRRLTPNISSVTAGEPSTDHSSAGSRTRRDVTMLSISTAAGAVLFGIVATYCFSALPSLDQFMSTQTFGPRFLLTGLALILKTPLVDICIRVTASISFTRLAARPRYSYHDLKVPVPLTPIGSVWYALQRGAWLAGSYAAAGGVVIEVLLILLPGVPFKSLQHAYIAPRISCFGSIACLALLMLVTVVAWIQLLCKRSLVDNRAPRPKLGPMLMLVAGTSMAADNALERSSGGMYALRHANEQRWVIDYANIATDEGRIFEKA